MKTDKYAGFTVTELRKAFTAIADKKNWKMGINAVIPEADFEKYNAAAIFIAGSPLEQVGKAKNGKIRVVGAGYYACIGA